MMFAHRTCECGFGWYGASDEPCPHCAIREQFPEIPRPIDIGINANKEQL